MENEWTLDDERRALEQREENNSVRGKYKPMTYPKDMPPPIDPPADWEIGFDFRIYRDVENGRTILESRSDAMQAFAHVHFSRYIDRVGAFGYVLSEHLPIPMARRMLEARGLIDEQTYVDYMEYEQLRQAEQHQADCDEGDLS